MAKARLPVVQERIEALLGRQNAPINMSNLHRLYMSKYKEALDYNALGFPKLKSLIETIPSVGFRQQKSQLLIFLIPDDEYDDISTAEAAAADTTTSSNSSDSPTSQLSSTSAFTSDSASGFSSSTHASNDSSFDKFVIRPRNRPAPTLLQKDQTKTPPATTTTTLMSDFQHLDTGKKSVKNGNKNSSHSSSPLLLLDKPISSGKKDKIILEQDKVDVSSLLTRPSAAAKGQSAALQLQAQRACLGDEMAAACFEEMSLLGHVVVDDDDSLTNSAKPVFLNTHEPFCLTAVGVQGAGKSHSLATVLESCLVPCESDQKITRLHKPMTALVLHYDQNITAVCEAAGLLLPSPKIRQCASVPKSKAVVVVSPTFYRQRKQFYGDFCTVRPLLFKWSSLTADHIKRIMRIGPNDNQLYVASFMTLLRRYQRQDVVPNFSEFIAEVREACNVKGQSGPLDQRIALLESMVAESEVNQSIANESMDLKKALDSQLNLIIADLTDPLLSKEEANCLFQVLAEQFRSIPVQGGKVLALDEAHKFMDGVQSDGLSEAIVNVARLMRHDGMRLIVSTQSPKALAPELLELVSVALLHHFHSKDWWTYLRQKLPLPEEVWEKILSLRPGTAIAFASRSAVTGASSHVLQLHVRPRLTADLGGSRTNQ